MAQNQQIEIAFKVNTGACQYSGEFRDQAWSRGCITLLKDNPGNDYDNECVFLKKKIFFFKNIILLEIPQSFFKMAWKLRG